MEEESEELINKFFNGYEAAQLDTRSAPVLGAMDLWVEHPTVVNRANKKFDWFYE